MKVTKVSRLTGKESSREIDITPEQFMRVGGPELIQNIVPHLSADDREFLISGITPEEWNEAFGKEEDSAGYIDAVDNDTSLTKEESDFLHSDEDLVEDEEGDLDIDEDDFEVDHTSTDVEFTGDDVEDDDSFREDRDNEY